MAPTFLLNRSQLEAIPHQVIVTLHPKLHIQWLDHPVSQLIYKSGDNNTLGSCCEAEMREWLKIT